MATSAKSARRKPPKAKKSAVARESAKKEIAEGLGRVLGDKKVAAIAVTHERCGRPGIHSFAATVRQAVISAEGIQVDQDWDEDPRGAKLTELIFPGGKRFATTSIATNLLKSPMGEVWVPSKILQTPPEWVVEADRCGCELGYDRHEDFLLSREDALLAAATANVETLAHIAGGKYLTGYWRVPIEVAMPDEKFFSHCLMTGTLGKITLNIDFPVRLVVPTAAEQKKFAAMVGKKKAAA